MTKSMARNEVETTYRLDVLERKMGDLQERMNRMETLLQGMINPQTRVNEKRPMQDLGQPGDLDREMARRLDDLRQIVATGWEQDQLPDESTPEGNSKLPSTGLSLAATGWGEDPKPHAVIASPTLNNPNPSYGPEMAKDMEKGVSAVAEKHALIEGVVLNTLDKQIRHFTGSENTPMVYPLKPDIEEIQKSDLTQLYMGKRADKRLRCTGLLWKLPPWPDFCAMNCDLIAHYSGYEVLVNFHSVKQYSLSVLDYIIRFEEPLAVYKSENSLQNPHFLLNCMVLIALKKWPIDQNSQDCKIADIHYGTGAISGFVSEGSVAVSDLVVKDQEFIEATREPSLTFMVAKFDGVLGLGCQEISVGNAIPMWYNMVEQVLIVDHVFSLWFNRRADDLSLDIPSAVTLFDKLVSIAISEEWLDASLSKSAIPDGTIVGREDKKRSQVVCNWDPGTGSKNMRWRRHVLTKDTAGSVKLWEVTREAVKTMKKAEKVLLKIKPQKGFGERGKLAAGEEGALPPNAIFLVDLESVYARARNDTGTLLVSGGTEEVVRVWDPGAGLKNMKGQGHTNNIRALLPDYTGSSEGDQSVYLTDWFLVSTSCNIPDFTYYLADNGKQWVQADGEEVSFKKLQEIPADKWAADRCGSGLIVACNNPSSPLLAGVLPSFQYGRGVYSCWLTHEVLSSEMRLIFDASSLVLGLYPENFSIKQSMSSSRNSSVPDGLWEYAVNRHLAAVFGAYCYQLPRRHSPMLYKVEKHSEDYMLSKVEGLTLSNFVIGKEQNVHVEGDNICSKENNCLPGHLPSYSSEPSAAVNAPYSLGKLLQLTIVQNRSVVLGVAGASYRDMLMSWGLPVCRNPLSSNNVSFDDGHFGTQSFQQVTKVKSQVVMEILRRGCNVLLSNVDVYWFDNPVQFLYSLGPVTFAAHADEYDETGPIILPHRWNSGFYFARSDNPTITAMEMIEKYATNLSLFEQPSFYDVQCGKERANRNGDDKSVKMTKWFDTNYLFIVPEPGSSIKFSYSSHKAVNEYKKAKALVVDTVIFPVYKEVIAELKAAGASWVQFDEPTLVLDLDSYQLAAFSAAYTELELAFSGLNVLDKTYLAEGRLTEARNIFDLRVCVGVMPDVVSYNIMIYGHGFVGRMDEAVKLLDGMVLTGWKPNAFIYSTLLDGYCKEGRTEDTTTLFKEMWGKGINPGAITYIIMLDGLFKTWRTAVAKEFLKSLKVVYKLQLPKGVGIHRVSHVSQLKIHCGPKAITSPDLSLVIKDDKLRVEPISVLEIIVLLRDRLVSQQLIQWEICHLLMLMGRCQLHQCYFSRIFTHKSLNLGFLISILEDKYVFKGEGMSESGDIFGLKVCCFFGELPLRQFKQIASTARMSSYSKKEHQWPRSIPAVLV